MNINIDHLYKIAKKPERLIIGLMSGTSLDGLDVAICRCTGAGTSTKIKILHFETVPYNDDYKLEIKSIFSKQEVNLEKVCLLNGWIAEQHATIINNCLQNWNIASDEIDLIASHGQTIYHAPSFLHGNKKFGNATLQIGDGDHLAYKTGIITISDFRQKNIAAGGEGAPLAVYGDYLIFSENGENRIMLNIGGIANFTFLPGDENAVKIYSTDTGPGNTLMDGYIQTHFEGKHFDDQSLVANEGTVNEVLLSNLKDHSFFLKGFPKTTGPELFNAKYVADARVNAGTGPLSHEDMMATLNQFSADTIVNAIKKCSGDLMNVVIYTSGGGMHNPLLMQNIQTQLPNHHFKITDSLGIDPDAKEAVLFALLANECVAGGQINIGNGSKDIPFVSMGKISFPL